MLWPDFTHNNTRGWGGGVDKNISLQFRGMKEYVFFTHLMANDSMKIYGDKKPIDRIVIRKSYSIQKALDDMGNLWSHFIDGRGCMLNDDKEIEDECMSQINDMMKKHMKEENIRYRISKLLVIGSNWKDYTDGNYKLNQSVLAFLDVYDWIFFIWLQRQVYDRNQSRDYKKTCEFIKILSFFSFPDPDKTDPFCTWAHYNVNYFFYLTLFHSKTFWAKLLQEFQDVQPTNSIARGCYVADGKAMQLVNTFCYCCFGDWTKQDGGYPIMSRMRCDIAWDIWINCIYALELRWNKVVVLDNLCNVVLSGTFGNDTSKIELIKSNAIKKIGTELKGGGFWWSAFGPELK